MSTTLTYEVQRRSRVGAPWTRVTSPFGTKDKADAYLMDLVATDPPGHWDGRLRVVEVILTTSVVTSVRGTVS